MPTGVAIAPVVPGLSESEVPKVLARAAAAGARHAFMIALRLPAEVEDVFTQRLREALPEREGHVLSAVRDVRGGALSSARFGERMGGRGPRWRVVQELFETTCRRLGLSPGEPGPGPPTFRRPSGQRTLFEA